MTVNISGQVPGEQGNGLLAIEEELLLDERTPEPLIAVCVIDRASLKYNDVKQEWSAVIRFRQIEPVLGSDATDARALLERAYARRTGEQTLPIPIPLDIEDSDDDGEDA